jgi:hypothetical protein
MLGGSGIEVMINEEYGFEYFGDKVDKKRI